MEVSEGGEEEGKGGKGGKRSEWGMAEASP